MARPRKPDDQLTRPRTVKSDDGKVVLPKGRPSKAVAELKKLVEEKQRFDNEPVEMGNMTPLEYALNVMNDPREPKERRDRLCVAILPFCHVKQGEGGKREKAAEKAEKLSSGKFAAAPPPLRAVK